MKFTNDEFTNGTYKVGWSTSAACYTQRLIEGQSLGTFYGPIWLGTDTDGKDVLLGQNADGSVPEEQWEKLAVLIRMPLLAGVIPSDIRNST